MMESSGISRDPEGDSEVIERCGGDLKILLQGR
jgi:hypothetical protein